MENVGDIYFTTLNRAGQQLVGQTSQSSRGDPISAFVQKRSAYETKFLDDKNYWLNVETPERFEWNFNRL
jgi:hypothetical protein